MLISRYSDTVAFIKQGSTNFTLYVGDLYSESIPLSCSKIDDLFDTSAMILVFRHQVFLGVILTTIP